MRIMLFVAMVALLLSASSTMLLGQTPSANVKVLQPLVSSNLIRISLDIPEDELLNKPGEPSRVASKLYVRVIVKNDSDQLIEIRLADRFYQNRPQLFRNGKLVPYISGLSEALQKREHDPQFINLHHMVSVLPYSSEKLTEVELSDWYDDLAPGTYQLINRYRLDVRGPWTPDSAPLSFEVVPKN